MTSHETPLGARVDDQPALAPGRDVLAGKYICLEPVDAARHADSLWEAVKGPENDYLWAYLFAGPFGDREALRAHLAGKAAQTDPLLFALLDPATGGALGHAAYMRIEPAHRVIEVGNILYAPALQRTRAATEAMYLMARRAFDELGYRRYEWKCHALNEPSRRAAERLGFTFEGVFRQHMIVKGRTRDTAWYSMTDAEWPARKQAFERWLASDNFDAQGRQKRRLEQCR